MGSTKLLTERFSLSGGTVDRTGMYPVVRGVLLCGTTSANRRRYKPSAFGPADRKRYEGRPIFIDHGDSRKSRGFRDKLAWVENERRDSQGRPIGDIGVNPKHDQAEPFLWLAEHKPDQCGMSHVAHCNTVTSSDGWEDVTEVVDVESVDVVVDPATTKGLYENRNRNRTMPLTVKALCESLVKHPKIKSSVVLPLKKLAEMDGMDGAYSTMDAPPEDEAEPGDGVKDAFSSAIAHLADQALDGEMDLKEALTKIKELIASHHKVSGKGGKEEPEEEEAGEEEAAESKRPSLAAVIKECTAAGYTPLNSDLLALAEIKSKDSRAAFIDAKKLESARPGSHPTQVSRRPGAGSAGATSTTTTTESKQSRVVPAWDE